jgi:hypothetical protein
VYVHAPFVRAESSVAPSQVSLMSMPLSTLSPDDPYHWLEKLSDNKFPPKSRQFNKIGTAEDIFASRGSSSCATITTSATPCVW